MTRYAPIHSVAALLLIAGTALAQTARLPDVDEAPMAEAPRPAPQPDRLEDLLAALADSAAPDPSRIEARIVALWSRSGSDSMDFLLGRGREAMEAEDYDRALEHLGALVDLEPDFAEGWNARATVHFLRDDYWSAVADVQRVLALEPRHFGALSGLAIMLERVGAEASALAAHRAALSVNPHIKGAQEAVKRLAPKVDGRDI